MNETQLLALGRENVDFPAALKIVINQVDRLPFGRHQNTVRGLGIIDDPGQATIKIDSVDAYAVLLTNGTVPIPRVIKVDLTFRIEAQVIRTVEPLPFIFGSKDFVPAAILESHYGPEPRLSLRAAGGKSTIRVEIQPVRAPARFTPDFRFTGWPQHHHTVVRAIREEEIALIVSGRALGKPAATNHACNRRII